MGFMNWLFKDSPYLLVHEGRFPPPYLTSPRITRLQTLSHYVSIFGMVRRIRSVVFMCLNTTLPVLPHPQELVLETRSDP